MTCIVVHNSSGTISTNGEDLPVDCSRGLMCPVTIEGDGEVYISVNPDSNIQDAVYDPDTLELISEAIPADPVSVSISDALGHITIINQNTRYPEEGIFPLLHHPLVIADG